MRRLFIITYTTLIVLFLTLPAYAMHIMEGFLPFKWALFWWLAILPVAYLGLRRIKSLTDENPQLKILLAFVGAFVFVLSALKIPSVTGSSSHPTGIGLGTILFGPTVMSVISMIVLLFQALLLAHGGISTLGANTFSMGVAGPIAGYLSYYFGKKLGFNNKINIFLTGFIADVFTYVVTSTQLALAFSNLTTFTGIFLKFLAIFAVTQLPLAIADGILTVLVFNFLESFNKEELQNLQLLNHGSEEECKGNLA